MRTITAVCLASLLVGASVSAQTNPLSLVGQELRVEGGGRGKRRLMTRGDELTLVLSGVQLRRQVLKVGQGALREVRLSPQPGWTELELRFTQSADTYLTQLPIRADGNDLVLGLAALGVDAKPAAKPAAPKAEENAAAAAAGDADEPQAVTAPTRPAAETPKAAAKVAAPAPAPTPAPAKAKPAAPEKAEVAPAGDAPVAEKAPAASPATVAGVTGTKRAGPPTWLTGQRPSSAGSPMWMSVVLLLAVAAGIAYWLKRRRRLPQLEVPQIDVVAAKSLGGKQRLVLVDAAGELLLLGCTEKNVSLLKTVGLQETRAREEKPVENIFARFEGSAAAADQDAWAQALAAANPEASAAAPAPAASKAAPMPTQNGMSGSFMHRLNEQMQRKRMSRASMPEVAPATEKSPAEEALDERWAEGILRLRRSRQESAVSRLDDLHA
ncbi:MAG: flagellar biosynthetic protein FliO [Deltaproteobacteria bacterium]|nr:flagellar biosynthetic protein FliO [Deltaproteobacteria bacterium]